MTGMTNRPEPVEDANQERVEEHRDHLAPPAQRGKKDHPVSRNTDGETLPEEGRAFETGVGRGPDHSGH